MKQYITRAQMRQMFDVIILCDEIAKIAVLCGLRPEYYNAGVLGWNWDAYDLGGVAVIGGDRSFPKYTARVDCSDAKRIENHISGLKTKRGKIAAAIRLIKRYAK